MTAPDLVQVRCPYCGRLAAEVSSGSKVRKRCERCRRYFEVTVTAEPT
jgi:phage FluMu protein Com